MQSRAVRFGLWLAVPLAIVLLLASVGDPMTASLRYLITWVLSVLLPGMLLWRALTGGRSIAQDLGFGAVLGLAWQLPVWALCTALDVPKLQWIALLGFYVVFVLVPPLRRRAGRSPEQTAPGWWSSVLAISLLVAVLRTVVGLLRAWPLPPIAFDRHQDYWYQLGLVQSLLREVRPPDLSILGEPLIYHWFANASIASQSLMANVDPAAVLMHHWQITFVMSLVLAGWAAGEALTGKTWVGAAGGVLSGVLPGMIQLVGYPIAEVSPAQIVQGPTGALAALVMLGLVGPTVLILRKQATIGTWIAMALMIGIATGTKPTVLPIMLAGSAVVGLYAWITERRLPRRILALGALAGGFFLAATVALTGSTGGSRIQFLAAVRALPFYASVTGDRSYPATGGWVVPSLATGELRLVFFVAALAAYYLLINGGRMLALLGTVTSPARRDPAYWWLAGCVTAGTFITLVFSHTGFSEYHFLRTVTALGVVGAVAVASTLIDEKTRWRPILAAAAAAFGVALLIRGLSPDSIVVTSAIRAYAVVMLPFQLVALAAALVIMRTKARTTSLVLLQVIAVVIAAGLPNQLAVFGENLTAAVRGQQVQADPRSRVYLTEHEQEAAIWLGRHAQWGDVAVSNVFCMPAPYRRGCPDDAFWISGLSGVQQYLGGWAYAPVNLSATHNRTSFLTQPSPWPDRLQHSLDAIRRPSPQLLAMLKNQVGVDWIVADLRAGPVSPALDRLAERVYANDDVRIYRLR
ncbi:hypothetical protein FB561_0079 [Kribbella amoyensis]|uniref:Uncharacterized protein n=1 Tax=Kribbella amoyensis TaxID=996641 RepID=A0A561BJH9_9ACTN|nr:hypothetical protein [Kribbella amoyensis]TWD79029.1 hypothetical protein FB561_0079 [Kribbella amoyensis]